MSTNTVANKAPVARKKVTKTSRKVVKKATKKAPAKKVNSNVVMTLKQALSLQTRLLKNGRSFKFLDSKINLLA